MIFFILLLLHNLLATAHTTKQRNQIMLTLLYFQKISLTYIFFNLDGKAVFSKWIPCIFLYFWILQIILMELLHFLNPLYYTGVCSYDLSIFLYATHFNILFPLAIFCDANNNVCKQQKYVIGLYQLQVFFICLTRFMDTF